jgi:hypothetical protein
MSWRVATSLLVLRAEIDAKWPNRDRRSDGTIGDAAHISEGQASDHNPWIVDGGIGVVRALDIDVDGIDAAWYSEHVRQLGAAGDHRLTDHGYVIFNRRIASGTGGWGWRAYTGPSPHTDHVHVSVARNKAGYDSTAAWGIHGAPPAHSPAGPAAPSGTVKFEQYRKGAKPGSRPLHLGSAGDDVAFLQRWIGGVKADGYLGDATVARLRWYQAMRKIPVNGVADSAVWSQILAVHAAQQGHL